MPLRDHPHPWTSDRWSDGGVGLLIVLWTALWALARARPSGISWHFFPFGSDLLIHGAHLHLYAAHPELQIGPLAFLVAVPLGWLPAGTGLAVAQILMTAALPAALAVLAPLVPRQGRRRRILLAALVVAPIWTVLSVRWVHLDDALALLLLVVAVRAAREDRAILTGLVLALAVDAKPWAVLGLPLLLLLTRRRSGAVTAGLGIVAAWAPFLLADHATLGAFHPLVGINGSSALSLFGYRGDIIPGWDRTAQLVLAPLAALVAVRRDAWAAALLCGIAVRLALDPQDLAYYAAGATLAAAVFDLLATRWLVPWTTLVTGVVLWQPFVLDYPRRFETSHGLSLWWFTHPHQVAAIHLAWAVLVVPFSIVVGGRRARWLPLPRTRRVPPFAPGTAVRTKAPGTRLAPAARLRRNGSTWSDGRLPVSRTRGQFPLHAPRGWTTSESFSSAGSSSPTRPPPTSSMSAGTTRSARPRS